MAVPVRTMKKYYGKISVICPKSQEERRLESRKEPLESGEALKNRQERHEGGSSARLAEKKVRATKFRD
jgi:hypothetical protein